MNIICAISGHKLKLEEIYKKRVTCQRCGQNWGSEEGTHLELINAMWQPDGGESLSDKELAQFWNKEKFGNLIDKHKNKDLNKKLNHKDPSVRARAAVALGEAGDSQAVEALIAATKDEDSEVQEKATEALGKIGDTKAVEPLLLILEVKNVNLRNTAITSLGQLRDIRAVEPLIKLIEKGPGISSIESAAEALRKIGDKRAGKIILALLQKEQFGDESYLGKVLAKALSQINDPNLVEPLIVMLKDSQNSMMRSAAVRLLGHYGKVAFDPVSAALKDKDYFVRKAATEMLGQIGDERALEQLTEALKDPSEIVQKAATEALKKIKEH